MQYSVAHLRYSFAHDWQQELFEQAMCDLGFEVFDEANAYIQTALLDEQRDAIMQLVALTDGVEFIAWEDCPDENWNAQWEAEHQPIQLPMDVRITPHCAFGAGHHETTSMMIQSLIEYQSNGYFTSSRSVLDMGCGTGVLAIMASKCGTTHVVAVDIDDKSVSNTLENAADNAVELDVRLASTPPEGHYDLILANIHRNILITQMPAYAAYLKADGELWLSGFYAEDIPALSQAAHEFGLSVEETRNTNEWHWMRLKR
jgi:ribosomal protein L11 methyltransferase